MFKPLRLGQRVCPVITPLSRTQQRSFAQENFTPPDMPIVKRKWEAAAKVGGICESMKNVAAGALPIVERHLSYARPFSSPLLPVFEIEEEPQGIQRVLHVCIGTERGLCGALSSNTVRVVRKYIDQNPSLDHSVAVFGKRSYATASAVLAKELAFGAMDIKGRNPTFELCCEVADYLITTKSDWDKAIFYFNAFENAVRFNLEQSQLYETDLSEEIGYWQLMDYEFEGLEDLAYENMLEYKLGTKLYLCFAENLASEQASRLQSMDGATKRCNEIVEEYAAVYQKLRKTKITNELGVLSTAVAMSGN